MLDSEHRPRQSRDCAVVLLQKSNYRCYDVWELPPNCQGIAELQLLNIRVVFADVRYGGYQAIVRELASVRPSQSRKDGQVAGN